MTEEEPLPIELPPPPSFDDGNVLAAIEKERQQWSARSFPARDDDEDASGPQNPHLAFDAPVSRGRASSQASRHNFQVTFAGAASTVADGTIGGFHPSLDGGDELNVLPAPTFTISASGTRKIYAVITGTVTVTDGFVRAYSITGVDIQEGASVPADNGTTTWHIDLATVVDGIVVTPQTWITSLPIHLTDSGNRDGTAILLILATS